MAALFCLAAPRAQSAEDTPSDSSTKPGSQPTTKSGGGQPNTADTAGSDDVDFSPSGLLSAFHKERQKLKDLGITFKVHEESEVWANVTGGGKQGVSYDGLTIGKLDFDLEKLFGWSGGEFLVEAFDIHAHGPSRNFVGNLQLVSNIEATPSVKLYDLWLDQSLLDNKLSFRFGQEGVNDELMTSTYGGLFLNSSFGFPEHAGRRPALGRPELSRWRRRLPAPGSRQPTTSPWSARSSTATRPRRAPAIRKPATATAPPFGSTTTHWDSPKSGISPTRIFSSSLPTTYKLGGWYSSDNFADQRFDTAGGAARQPREHGDGAAAHRRNWAFLRHRRSDDMAAPGLEGSGYRRLFPVSE